MNESISCEGPIKYLSIYVTILVESGSQYDVNNTIVYRDNFRDVTRAANFPASRRIASFFAAVSRPAPRPPLPLPRPRRRLHLALTPRRIPTRHIRNTLKEFPRENRLFHLCARRVALADRKCVDRTRRSDGGAPTDLPVRVVEPRLLSRRIKLQKPNVNSI